MDLPERYSRSIQPAFSSAISASCTVRSERRDRCTSRAMEGHASAVSSCAWSAMQSKTSSSVPSRFASSHTFVIHLMLNVILPFGKDRCTGRALRSHLTALAA